MFLKGQTHGDSGPLSRKWLANVDHNSLLNALALVTFGPLDILAEMNYNNDLDLISFQQID